MITTPNHPSSIIPSLQNQDQERQQFTGRKIYKRRKNKEGTKYSPIILTIVMVSSIIAIVIGAQLLLISQSNTQTIQRESQEKKTGAEKSINEHQDQQKWQTTQLEPNNEQNQNRNTSSPDFFSPKQTQLRQAQIRSQITKRKIYINKFITQAEKDQQQQPDNLTGSITLEQLLQAVKLINTTATKGTHTALEAELRDLENKYRISQYTELPFCIVVPTYNNYKHFKYYFNANSILQQNYTRFHTIFIDDASTDHTASGIQEVLDRVSPTQRVTLVKNPARRGHMVNIYQAVHDHCQKGELLMIVDGDDELIGRQVLKLINAYYQQTKALAIYTNHVRAIKNAEFLIGTSQDYPPEVKRNNSYRWAPHSYSHLKTTWVDIFLEIGAGSLKDKSGNWFQNAVDNAFYFCVLELSCGEVEYLPELSYRYNMFTGNNIFEQARKSSRNRNAAEIREKQPYPCLSQVDPETYRSIKTLLS